METKKIAPRLERQPDVQGTGLFDGEQGFIGEFECAVFLPNTETEKIWIAVRGASLDTNPVILNWKFSCKLTAGREMLSAEEIFHSGYTSRDWGNGIEQSLLGEITKITLRRGDITGAGITRSRFMITQSALLRSVDSLSGQSGVVNRRVARSGPVCRVTQELEFQFSSAYRQGGREWSIEAELLQPARMVEADRVVTALRNVLILASFAERRLLLLTGWFVEYANGATVTFYRRDFSLSTEAATDIDESLISLADIQEFLNASVENLLTLQRPDAFKQVIDFTLRGQERGIADSYAMLFAGIETLLNLFVSDDDLEPIVPKTEWNPLLNRIRTELENAAEFQSLKDEIQKQLLTNIATANRAYFRDRFRRMCASQNIDLRDLWPMSEGRGTLYEIRNRIVHGRIFSNDEEWFRIVSAKHHLVWTLERSVLCLLKWPVSRSRVSSGTLSQYTFYSRWAKYREYFSKN